MSVNQQGKLVLPDGMTYSVLVLPQTQEMTLPVLKKIQKLVSGGAIVVGPKPKTSPSLADSGSDSLVQQLAFEIWGDLDGVSRTKRSYGKGKVVWGLPLDKVLKEEQVSKDVAFNCPDDQMSWIHRRTGNADIYFVVNRGNTKLDLSGQFNVTGKEPELWNPDTGSFQDVTHTIDEYGTKVDFVLPPHGSVFVVFGRKARISSRLVLPGNYNSISELSDGWNVQFPKGLGAPEKIHLQHLESWTQNADEGVRYFSGTATYTKTFDIRKEWLKPGWWISLDLGTVKDMAEVYVNGKRINFLWKTPFIVNITPALKAGPNKLEVRITNEWTNRLVGDKEHPEHKVLDSYPPPFGGRQYELQTSGLIGPVWLILEKENSIKLK
jgi:hypothetical protein